MSINWSEVPENEKEKVAFLYQVKSFNRDEWKSRFPLGCPTLKDEGGCIRTADFLGVDPNGYDLFSSDEERLNLLTKYGIV
jgi:hypothetical protein